MKYLRDQSTNLTVKHETESDFLVFVDSCRGPAAEVAQAVCRGTHWG